MSTPDGSQYMLLTQEWYGTLGRPKEWCVQQLRANLDDALLLRQNVLKEKLITGMVRQMGLTGGMALLKR